MNARRWAGRCVIRVAVWVDRGGPTIPALAIAWYCVGSEIMRRKGGSGPGGLSRRGVRSSNVTNAIPLGRGGERMAMATGTAEFKTVFGVGGRRPIKFEDHTT